MKKILFNDKFRLTEAVLNGTKTMTRRFIKEGTPLGNWEETEKHAPFQVGEMVAITQSYSDILEELIVQKDGFGKEESDFQDEWYGTPGWTNKMFTKPELMVHHIKITGLRAERLQDITEEECLKEGIKCHVSGNVNFMPDLYNFDGCKPSENWGTAREAFATLIDKVGKHGTWESNPWVYVYSFELVD